MIRSPRETDRELTALGEQLRTWRKELGLSIEKWAQRLGYSYRTVSGWELGEHVPPPGRLAYIVAVRDHLLAEKTRGHSAPNT